MKKNQIAKLENWHKSIDINFINKKFGTPTWIVFEKQLIKNVNSFIHFTDKKRILFPIKTNPSLSVLQILADLGVGADCASKLEIDLALYAGFKVENISYNSPIQDIQICKFLLQQGASIVLDDVDSIFDLQTIINSTEITGKILLRINLIENVSYKVTKDNQELMAHAESSSKFGIPEEEVEKIVSNISMPISGLHVHVGTQMDNVLSFENAINRLNRLSEHLNKKFDLKITEINLGGGLGIPFSNSDNFPSIDYWCNYMNKLKDIKFNYSIEPGHALVGNAVSLLTKVDSIKNSRGKKWAIVDVGTDLLAKVTLLKWPHRIISENGEEFKNGKDAIAGPLCFAGDVLLDNIDLSNIAKGSPLLITEAGAYTYSLANKFNGRLAANWITIKNNGKIIQSMKAEQIVDDLQFQKYEWNFSKSYHKPKKISPKKIKLLSSNYLKKGSERDRYKFLKVEKISENKYEFIVNTNSEVDFVSMPFIIRIVGDATIISVLNNEGYANKDISVWGRKLTLDCFEKIETKEPLIFTINLSSTTSSKKFKTIISKFKTSCEKCIGTFVIKYPL